METMNSLKKGSAKPPTAQSMVEFAAVTVEGYRIALLHGEETELLNALVNSGYFDAVIHGHSHNRSVEKMGKTLFINPGELCGYLTGKSTLALLDTVKQEAKIIEL